MTLLGLKFVMIFGDVEGIMDENPVAFIGNMIYPDYTTGSRIFKGCASNGADTKFDSLIDGHVVLVVSIKNTISEGTSRTDGEEVSSQPGGVIIDVVKGSAGFVRSSEHRSHGETVSLVLTHNAAKHHRGHGDRWSLSVSKLVNTTLHGYILLPELAIGGTTSHSSQDELIDFDDFTNIVGRDERTHGGSGIDCYEDTALELKGKSGSTLGELGHLWSHSLQISLELNLVLSWVHLEAESVRLDLGVNSVSLMLDIWVFMCLEVGTWGDKTKWCSSERFGESEVLAIHEGVVLVVTSIKITVEVVH